MKKVIISEKELAKYTTERDIASRAKGLLESQKLSWPLLSDNYKQLHHVNTKEFEFDGFTIKVQNNPQRIISTAADVEAKVDSTETSFLHFKNLPDDQKSIRYYKEYLILCNPYPIFPEHFTIPSIIQKPQSILEHARDFLYLSRDMQKHYLVFYNGPKCGASAPEHLHFQAGNKNFMPIDTEYDSIKNVKAKKFFFNRNLIFYFCTEYLRNFISIESTSIDELLFGFNLIYTSLQKIYNTYEEPMMNVLLYYSEGHWRMIIFPRHRHRPTYYFNEGELKILVSPGAVDLGGVMILPREEDFDKITKDNIIDIYRQVCIPKEFIEFTFRKVKDAKAATNT